MSWDDEIVALRAHGGAADLLDADEASGGGEIAFELPADTPAFTVFVEALVVLDLDDYDGEFIEGEVRLSGPGVP